MEFAVNYSPHADRLVERGAIDVDLFKCPEFPDLISDVRTRHRCYVHFRYRLGRRPFGEVDWDEADQMLETTATRYVNAHLAPSVADFPGATVESGDEAFREQVVAAMKADARELVARYGRDRVVLENVMWDPDPPWQIPAAALAPEATISRSTSLPCASCTCTPSRVTTAQSPSSR